MKKYSVWLVFALFTGAFASDPSSSGGVQPLDEKVPEWSTFDAIAQQFITSGLTSMKSKLIFTDKQVDQVLPDNKLSFFRQKMRSNAAINAVYGRQPNITVMPHAAAPSGSSNEVTLQSLLNIDTNLYNAMGGEYQFLDASGNKSFNQPSSFSSSTSLLNSRNYWKDVQTRWANYEQNVQRFFQKAAFEPNWDVIAQKVKDGNFNNMNYYRLLFSEYLIGRVTVGVSVLDGSTLVSGTSPSPLPSDADIFSGFYTKAQTYLKQLRYARNAFTPHPNAAQPQPAGANQQQQNANQNNNASSNWGNFFGGAPNVNNNQQANPVPVATQSGQYIHYLTPADTFVGLILDNQTSGSQAFTVGSQTAQVAAGKTSLYPAVGTADNWPVSSSNSDNRWGKERSVSFNVEGVAGAGSVILYENQDQLPTISTQTPVGQVPVNFDQAQLSAFFKDIQPWAVVVRSTQQEGLKVVGLAKLSPLWFPDALKFMGKEADSQTQFTLGQLWHAPSDLYKATLSNVNEQAGQPYPFISLVLQGIFNGYLQTSTYKPVVPASTGSVNMNSAFATPTADQWIAQDSPLDWKLLRLLVATYSVQRMLYLNTQSLPHIGEILQSPQTDRPELGYIGSTQNYVPVVPVQAASSSGGGGN